MITDLEANRRVDKQLLDRFVEDGETPKESIPVVV